MLIIKNLNLQLGQFTLKKIDLKIDKGEYFVLLGPSGSGKTSLLETIAGRYSPTTGDIIFNNISLISIPPEKRNIGFVYQHYELFPHMTVEQNITFSLKIRKCKNEFIVNKLSELVSLLKIEHLLRRYPSNLSGGEQQRVALARALIMSPDLILFDEPMSALDSLTRSILQEEIKKIHTAFRPTILHVTHNIEEAFFLADKIGVMYQGEIIITGTPQDIIKNPHSQFINDFLNIERKRSEKYGFLYAD